MKGPLQAMLALVYVDESMGAERLRIARNEATKELMRCFGVSPTSGSPEELVALTRMSGSRELARRRVASILGNEPSVLTAFEAGDDIRGLLAHPQCELLDAALVGYFHRAVINARNDEHRASVRRRKHAVSDELDRQPDLDTTSPSDRSAHGPSNPPIDEHALGRLLTRVVACAQEARAGRPLPESSLDETVAQLVALSRRETSVDDLVRSEATGTLERGSADFVRVRDRLYQRHKRARSALSTAAREMQHRGEISDVEREAVEAYLLSLKRRQIPSPVASSEKKP